MAGFSAYAYAAAPGESVSLRGFCFDVGKNGDSCDIETTMVDSMYSESPFDASELRFRGTFERVVDGKALFTFSLDPDTRAAVLKELPQVTFHEFVSGKEYSK
jgi:hypothetical protein